jgi:hypothetical protein
MTSKPLKMKAACYLGTSGIKGFITQTAGITTRKKPSFHRALKNTCTVQSRQPRDVFAVKTKSEELF